MKVYASTLLFLFISVQAASLVSAQVRQDNSPPENKAEVPLISIELVGGGRLQVEELIETSEGIWYRRGGVTTLLDPKRVARIEGLSSGQSGQDSATPQDSPRWSLADAKKVESFFFKKFGRPLPTSAFGQSDIHDRWGLDHRQGWMLGFIQIVWRALPLLTSCEPR